MLTDDQKKQLVEIAVNTRQWAYAPYSKYHVGAALLSTSGRIYEGVNIENAAYPDSICAERVAVFKAISEGEKDFLAIAVVSQNGGSPCGSCRQVMTEFTPGMLVIIADKQGHIIREATLESLLPGAFTSDQLLPEIAKI